MKRFISLSLSALLAIGVLSGCKAEKIVKTEEISVIASVYPVYDFAKKIAGDKATVKLMVPAGSEPHDWEPKASDITAIAKSDIFIYNGAGMEHWIDQVAQSVGTENITMVEASKGITLLEGHHHHEDEEHEDEHEDESHEEAEAHDEDHEDEHDHHVWLSPLNAKIQLENIYNAFKAADSKNEAYYKANFNKYSAELSKLDGEFKEGLKDLKTNNIIVTHQAFGYLCEAYSLKQVPIEGLYADSEPTAARMAEIIKFVKENKVTTIFFEELVSSKVAETIASETGAKTDVLNPIEGLKKDQESSGKDYFSLMRDNLTALKKALK